MRANWAIFGASILRANGSTQALAELVAVNEWPASKLHGHVCHGGVLETGRVDTPVAAKKNGQRALTSSGKHSTSMKTCFLLRPPPEVRVPRTRVRPPGRGWASPEYENSACAIGFAPFAPRGDQSYAITLVAARQTSRALHPLARHLDELVDAKKIKDRIEQARSADVSVLLQDLHGAHVGCLEPRGDAPLSDVHASQLGDFLRINPPRRSPRAGRREDYSR